MTQFNRPDTPLSRDTSPRGYVPNASAEDLDDPETNNLNKHPMEHTNWVDPASADAARTAGTANPIDTAVSNSQIADEANGRDTNPLYADRDDQREGPRQGTNTPLDVSNRKQVGGVDGDINMPVRGVVPGNIGLPNQTDDKR
ncbi:hypothetical protein [Amantichitinum ursilacus]|uniref:Uncharacterized protein n=1 Tax=Amantichitinum ursilacus TaxID=857265 RepID=A0A0N0GQI8_9NEIS|nr:hypothetical protein [Amantichitinum ursilacus]KPC54733.1 hypothetical protein WG78_04145 [Amantichitinum ursilacus]